HAAGLRRRNIFAAVREAFWKQEPQVAEVIKGLATPRVFIVPLFMSEGHFSSDVIPRALGFTPGNFKLESPDSRWFYCLPVGTHERMNAVVLARARDIVRQFPFPRLPKPSETTLCLAGHGTEQNERSREAVERQAELVRARNEFAAVHAVFLEEEPRI